MFRLFLILLLCKSMLLSAPSELFKALMNSPTTMLDFGMYKLEKSLEGSVSKKLSDTFRVFDNVTYEWENDKLKVSRSLISFNDKEAINNITCKDNLKRFKEAFFMREGKKRNYYYVQNFEHNGFQKGSEKEQPKYEELPSKTILQINMHSFSGSKSSSCRSILTSNEILIIE